MLTKQKVSSDRKTAIIVGILFIIGTVAGILSAVVTGPVLSDPDILVSVSANENQIIIGALLVLTMGFALAMVPVMLYPIFKKQNEALALGAVLFRGALEAVAYIAIVLSWFLLISLSRNYVQAGTPDATYFHSLGNLILAAGDWSNLILAIVFSLGALIIYFLFYQSKRIPRWLSAWGFIGAIIYIAHPLLAMFDTKLDVLFVPLAVQEMVLAVWLIVKGFSEGDTIK